MRPLRAAGIAIALTALSVIPAAAAQNADPTSVYGLELEASADRERLLIFTTGSPRYRVVERDERTIELRIQEAKLDPSAPVQVAPGIGRSISWVRAREEADEVLIVITREPGRNPDVSSRGSMIAVDFAGARQREGPIALQFRNADIQDVVRDISDATGEAFIFDTDLSGQITIVVGSRVSTEEAVELLDSALLLLGHAALPTPAGPRKIVPIASGPVDAPWKPEGIGDTDRLASTLVRLETASADDIAGAIQPWLGQRAVAVPFAPTNSLILSGAESHLWRLLISIQALDEAARESLLVLRLRHRSVEEVGQSVIAWAEGAPGLHPVDVWSIPRNDTLVVRATPVDLDEVRKLVERLDRATSGTGEYHVIPIHNRDAGDVADALNAAAVNALAERDYAITVDTPTNALLARADPETAGLIMNLAHDLDRAPPQIRVELKLIEITTPKSLRVGLDAFIPFARSDGNSINALALNPSGSDVFTQPTALTGAFVRSPLIIPIVDENGRPSVTVIPRESVRVTAEQREIRTRIVMKPELLVTSGEEHELFAGNIVPVPTAGVDGAQPLTTNLDIERRNVGLRMRLLPTVTELGGVRLELDLEVSSLLPPLAGDVEQVGPTIREMHLNSVIRLEGSEFAVIGLGEERSMQNRERGVPWLKDLPVFGWLFRRTDDSEVVSRQLVAVSARVERASGQAAAASIRRQIAERQTSGHAPHRVAGDAAFAVRAATRRNEEDAHSMAESLRSGGEDVTVIAREQDGTEFFDIYLFGFESLADAAGASLRLAGPLYDPEVVALRDRGHRHAAIKPSSEASP